MKRRVFTILSAGSLLLCVAVVVLWVRNYYVETDYWLQEFDYVDFNRVHLSVWSSRGHVLTQVHDGRFDRRREGLSRSWQVWGFDYQKTHMAEENYYRVEVPYWSIAALGLLLPTCEVIRYTVGSRRNKPGLCPSCGYDLRETPERCPECGAVPAERVESPAAK